MAQLSWRRVALACLLVLALLAVGLIASAEPGKPGLYPPRAGEPVVDIYVVNHGYHSGLIVPVNRLYEFALSGSRTGAIATVQRFAGHRYLEIGWGDEGFYRFVPTIGSIEWGLAVAALTNRSRPPVLHLVGFDPEPATTFPNSSVVHIGVTEAGFAELVRSFDGTITLDEADVPEDLGPGLYGDSEFYRAEGLYNGLNDCNQWVAARLVAAGLPVSRATSTTSWGLMAELRWRAGAD